MGETLVGSSNTLLMYLKQVVLITYNTNLGFHSHSPANRHLQYTIHYTFYVAHLGEHLTDNQSVVGSIPIISNKCLKGRSKKPPFFLL